MIPPIRPLAASKSRPAGSLVKQNLAQALKNAILEGSLLPGQRVVEGKWARHFRVAQASVREAINLLVAEGFLTKDSGRSARVVRYSRADVTRIYEVRAALEGMAAQLAAERKADLGKLDAALSAMRAAARKRDTAALIESDLAFHLALCEASGNSLLLEMARRVLTPLFAFVELRVLQTGQGPEPWIAEFPVFRRMVELIREGDSFLAGRYVHRAIERFLLSAYAVWSHEGGEAEAGDPSAAE